MDMILYNANIYTMDPNDPRGQAIGIKENKIALVGENEDVLAQKTADTKVINLNGQTVLPGFNDSHMHLLSYGYGLEMVNLNGVASIDALIEKTKTFIKENNIPSGQWVEGRGWNQMHFPKQVMPSKEDLDKISTDHKIIVIRTCGQICALNTRALKDMDLYENPPKLEGGVCETNAQGLSTGVFTGVACRMVFRKIPDIGVPRIKKALLNACNNYVKAGITSVQPDDFVLIRAGNFKDILQAYFELDKENALPVRINEMMYLPTHEELDEFLKMGLKTGDGSPFFKIGPYKLITDGSLGGKTAALCAPYEGDPNNVGETYFNQEEISSLVQKAYENGMQVVCDGIGDRALWLVLNAYKPILEKNMDKDLRFCIDHCQITTEGIIEEFKKYNIIGGLELVFVASDIAIAEECLGKHRASLSYNWKRFIDNGVIIAAGCDSPVEGYNPIQGIYAAVHRRGWDGKPEGGWNPDQKLTVEQAVHAFTTGPAYATFEEGVKGTITVGKYADLVVLSDDIFEIDPEKINEIYVKKTIVDGKVAYEK